MTAKPIKVPSADHPITIEPNPARVVVFVAGRVIADTRKVLTLREASYPAVQYIPRKDVDMSLLERTEHRTYCPTRANAPTTASLSAGSGPRMLCGRMRFHSPLSS